MKKHIEFELEIISQYQPLKSSLVIYQLYWQQKMKVKHWAQFQYQLDWFIFFDLLSVCFWALLLGFHVCQQSSMAKPISGKRLINSQQLLGSYKWKDWQRR